MPRPLDLTGRRFGRLAAIRLATLRPRRWFCLCDCGAEKAVIQNSLMTGNTQSCGCLRREEAGARFRSHGLSRTKEHSVWAGIKRRCFDSTRPDFPLYGGRGITMAPEWRHDFAAFLSHVGPAPSPKHSIDRIDNEGHYVPGNVRWATASEQVLNQRPRRRGLVSHRSRLVTFRGETLSLAALTARLGISYMKTYQRLETLGMSIEEAVRPGRLPWGYSRRRVSDGLKK